jgi:hypothetical protein
MAPVTMFPSAQTGETSKRTLEPDDVDGVCTIYPVAAAAALAPAGEPAATSASAVSSTNAFKCVPRPSVSRSSSGGCGAGSATPVGMAALALALAVLLPRGRRRAGR